MPVVKKEGAESPKGPLSSLLVYVAALLMAAWVMLMVQLMVQWLIRPSHSAVEHMVRGEISNRGFRLVSFRETNGPRGPSPDAPSFWSSIFCDIRWYEGEMEFTKDCYWRTEETGELTVLPVELDRTTRSLNDQMIAMKIAVPAARRTLALWDKVLSTMTRANKGQRLKIWGMVSIPPPAMGNDDTPSRPDPVITVNVVSEE